MPRFMMISDLTDPSDPQGRTYREVNNAASHKYSVGQLVELDNGVRLFVFGLTRDCDGTPLYSLAPTTKKYLTTNIIYGYCEESIKPVT